MLDRRTFFARSQQLLGPLALATLARAGMARADGGLHFPAKAKRVIYLFMSGGPSHVDLFDYKPQLERFDGQPIPPSIVEKVHFAMIASGETPRVKASPYRFRQHGETACQVSELLPHLAQQADDLCVIKSIRSEIFNHDPAVALLNTGDSRVGRPTLGAWLSYGLGTENENLPAYVVLTSGVKRQPLLDSYWSSGFLPSRHQGVPFRAEGDPVMFLSSPTETSRRARKIQIELIRRLNADRHQQTKDPEIAARIKQYELAFRMQVEAPELVNLSDESAETMAMYGAEPNKPSFARNCLLARRMVERGVRCVQLYDMGWDSHASLPEQHPSQCRAMDRGAAALLSDLRRRGLLEDTLVIWGGEFGRTPVAQGNSPTKWGRDHHPHGFTMWLAGGGVRPGGYGATDDFGFHAEHNRLDVHDVHATILHCLGVDHERLTFRRQGRDFRLTDVAGRVIKDLLL